MKTKEETAAKAREIWSKLTDSAKHGIRFGLFPAVVMGNASAEGYDSRELSIALMEYTKANGGMLA